MYQYYARSARRSVFVSNTGRGGGIVRTGVLFWYTNSFLYPPGAKQHRLFILFLL